MSCQICKNSMDLYNIETCNDCGDIGFDPFIILYIDKTSFKEYICMNCSGKQGITGLYSYKCECENLLFIKKVINFTTEIPLTNDSLLLAHMIKTDELNKITKECIFDDYIDISYLKLTLFGEVINITDGKKMYSLQPCWEESKTESITFTCYNNKCLHYNMDIKSDTFG